jgi:hypothetical protein
LTHTDHNNVGDLIDFANITVTGTPTYYTGQITFTADSGHGATYCGAKASQPSASTVAYFSLFSLANDGGAGVEASAQSLMRTSGSLTYLYAIVTVAPGASVTVTLRKNAANGNNTLTCTSGTTGLFEDTTPHTDSYVNGDKICAAIGTVSSGSITLQVGVTNTYSTNYNEVEGGMGPAANWFQNASDKFMSIAGPGPSDPTTGSEGLWQMAHNFAVGKASNLRVNVTTNNWVVTSGTVQTRKNGADANQIVTITAGNTGYFEDTTNSDSFTSGDLVDYVLRGGSAGQNAVLSNIMMTEGPAPPAPPPFVPLIISYNVS